MSRWTSLASGVLPPPAECIVRGNWIVQDPAYEFTLTAADEATAERVRENMRIFGASFTVVGADGRPMAVDPRFVRVQVVVSG